MNDPDRIQDALDEYEREHEFARYVLPPVEDQSRLGFPRRTGGDYRWFRSANVVDLEKVRRLKLAGRLSEGKVGRVIEECFR